MISTQYRLPWFLVAVTTRESMHKLQGPQMSLVGGSPPGKKKSLFFFLRSISQNMRGQEGISRGFREQRVALITSSGRQAPLGSLFPLSALCLRTAASQGFPPAVPTSLQAQLMQEEIGYHHWLLTNPAMVPPDRLLFLFCLLTWSKRYWKPVGFAEGEIWRSFTFKRANSLDLRNTFLGKKKKTLSHAYFSLILKHYLVVI